ncbi:LOW QUALITY PROTEIN: hypothetical protein YC2023_020268 [Brassica napus]
MAMELANEVVSNASVDLEGLDAAENSAVEVGVPHNHSLKIAALEALERNSSHHPHASDRDVMVSEEGNRQVVSETREGKGLAAKDSLLEEAEELAESLGESDDDSVPSLKADDLILILNLLVQDQGFPNLNNLPGEIPGFI